MAHARVCLLLRSTDTPQRQPGAAAGQCTESAGCCHPRHHTAHSMQAHHNHSSSSSSSAQAQLQLMDLLRQHTDAYNSKARAALQELLAGFEELEVEPDAQRHELAVVINAALDCWSSAAAGLRARQQEVRDSIHAALSSIQRIKAELGAEHPGADAELHKLQGNRSAHRTLRAWQHDVLSKAACWERRKKQRLDEYEDLQARVRLLRQLCGLPPQPPCTGAPDISASNMEFLKLELERLAQEKERREDLLRQLVEQLSGVCAEIGEDVRLAVAEVHEHLASLWDAEAAKVLRDLYRLGSAYSSAAGAAAGMVDLSDATISRLGSKLAVMRDLQASRGAHAREVLSVLHSLWDATEVPEAERAHFVSLMSGPLRLHAASLEKCMAEVRRLEDVRYQQMVDLVVSKGEALSALCRDSHVQEPAGLQAALTVLHSEERNPGAAAELLAKLLHMLAEVQVLAAKRGSIIAAINEVEAAHAEDMWLAAYEADDQRYKGRDANKRLQRAIRAGKLRERLPSLIEELRVLLAEWKEGEGEAFLFDGRDYEFEVLDGLALQVAEAAAARTAKAAAVTSKRRQSLAGTGPTSPGCSGTPGAAPAGSRLAGSTPRRAAGAPPTPPVSRVGSGRVASAAASPLPPRRAAAGGPSTPMGLRSISNRSLTERHSICVVRDRGGAVHGPAALSRSGEVRLRPTAAAAGHINGARTSGSSSGGGSGGSGRRTSTDSKAGLTSSGGGGSGADALAAPRRLSAGGFSAVGGSAGVKASSPATPQPSSTHKGAGVQGTPPAESGSVRRANTSSKLDTIFRRGSVQHPVAMLASEPSGLHTDSSTAADQGAV